jgi:hypothetical protein
MTPSDPPPVPSPDDPRRRRIRNARADDDFASPNPLLPDAEFNADGSSITEEALEELADHLGLPIKGFRYMAIAWQDEPRGGCWLFPETDGSGRRVGSTCRFRDGTTEVVPGGRRGLSEPGEWDRHCLPLLLPVGVSDVLAATALGLAALGRPGDSDGLDDLADRLRDVPARRPLIVLARGAGRGGAPEVAREAARAAAAELAARLGRPVSWALPPNGAHDIRAWATARIVPDTCPTIWLQGGNAFLERLQPQAVPVGVARGVTAAELLRRDLPPAAWVVEGLLPPGVTVLAGKPKAGKSWLALQLALAVAGGGSLPGAGPVTGGGVLYLALEDNEQRLRGRLERLLAGAESAAPARLSLVTRWPPLAEGGRDDLVTWLGMHPGTRLVVIDTLAGLRSRRRGGSHHDDSRTVEALRSLAARFGVAVLVVHHLRKGAAHDPFDAVLGRVEVTGTSDTVWVLARPRREGEAVLHVTGRDVGEQELALGWDGAGGRWAVLGAAEERRLSQEQARAIEVLAGARRPLTPREAAPLLGKTVGAAGVLLWRMAERGLLVSENGAYAPAGLPLPAPGASAKRFPAGEGSKD